MIKVLLFDWDDVFIRGSKEGYFDCYHQTLSELGIQLDKEEEKRRILENWGKHPKDELRGLLKEHPEKLDEAYEIYEGVLLKTDTFIKYIKPIDGIRLKINEWSKKYGLGIATGMNPKLLKKIITQFHIPDKFSKVISAYDIKEEENQKPSAYMLNELMTYFDIRRNEVIYVGDAKSDVLMARTARVTPVVVLTGHLSKPEAEKMGVKYIIEDVTKLDEVLAKYSA